MSRLLPVSPHELEKIVLQLGFKRMRQRGSHVFYLHPDGRYTTIPFHGNREIGPVLLSKILKEMQLNKEAYQNLL